MNQNFYNSNSSGFDQFQPSQYPVIHHPPQETSVEMLQARENLTKSIQNFLKKFNRISFRETPKVLSLAWDKFFEIQNACREEKHQREDIQELLHKLLNDLQIIENSSNAIAPVLPIKEPNNSLSMGDEHLSTIPEMESHEVIKSSVEDLVPILNESEDTSGSDSESVLPSDDESLSDEDVPKENVKTYSNPLFEFDDEYISSDINPLFDEVLEDIECKISYDSNLNDDEIELLFHHDPSISIVSILKGFADEPPLKENDDLFDLESKTNDWKKIVYDAPIDDLIFDSRDDIDEIDTFLD
nr:hypothetical protein [Tanacetum cinerariifolium]